MADLMRMLTTCARSLSPHFLLVVGGALLCLHGEARKCAYRYVKPLLRQCDPRLAAIQTAILSTEPASNFSHMCSTFEDYVICMESRLYDCESNLLRGYHDNRRVYSSAPYNCTPPDYQPPTGLPLAADPDDSQPEVAYTSASQIASVGSFSLLKVLLVGWTTIFMGTGIVAVFVG